MGVVAQQHLKVYKSPRPASQHWPLEERRITSPETMARDLDFALCLDDGFEDFHLSATSYKELPLHGLGGQGKWLNQLDCTMDRPIVFGMSKAE